jgi:hypothetical protein
MTLLPDDLCLVGHNFLEDAGIKPITRLQYSEKMKTLSFAAPTATKRRCNDLKGG